MAVCPVDANGYCSRHKVIHRGAWLKWATDPSEQGEAYRRKWDTRPTVQDYEPPVVPTPRQSQTPVHARKILPCVHLGQPTGQRVSCGHCGMPDQTTVLYACGKHGECTWQHRANRPGSAEYYAWCLSCPDYQPAQSLPARSGPWAISFRPPDRPLAAHGVGDATHFAHLIPLYLRRGIRIAVECLPDHAPIFRAAGAAIVPAGIPHPWVDPSRDFPGPEAPAWQHNKNGENLGRPPLPELLEDKETLWREYCEVRLDFSSQVGPGDIEWARRLLEKRPRPWIVMHTQGYGWGSFRNYPPEQAVALMALLVQRGASVFVLDREQSAPALEHPAVIRVRHFGLGQLYELMRQADLFIGIDSGPLHFLRFTDTPGLGLWDAHYPATFALPREQTLHLVAPHHEGRDVWQRRRWNTLLAREGLRPEFVAEMAWRLCQQPRYLPGGPIARDVQLQGWVDWTCSPHRSPVAHVAVDRHVSFDRVLRWLGQRTEPVIVETGTIRAAEDWRGAGYSTYLWAAFVEAHGGHVHSVDCCPAHVEFARQRLREFSRVSIHLADSVSWLRNYAGPPIDLLYLDSLDTDQPGHAEHCLAELETAWPHLARDAWILIDDTPAVDVGDFQGKGRLAVDWLARRGCEILHAGWQVLVSRRRSRSRTGSRQKTAIQGAAGKPVAAAQTKEGQQQALAAAFEENHLTANAGNLDDPPAAGA